MAMLVAMPSAGVLGTGLVAVLWGWLLGLGHAHVMIHTVHNTSL